MSVLGTSITGGIAQAAIQGAEAARLRDRQAAHDDTEARQVHDIVETHLLGLDEDDQEGSSTRPRVDEHVDQNKQPPQERKQRRGGGGAGASATAATANPTPVDAQPPNPVASDQTLYRHLDLQA